MRENMVVRQRWSHMKTKGPDRLSCRKADREIYDVLKKEEIFKKLDLIHIFMSALSIGYREKKRTKLDTKEGLILLYHVPPEYKNIMKAITVEEHNGDLGVLLDENEIYSIAEEYASGGIRILNNKITIGEFGSYIKRLESELMEMRNEMQEDAMS